MSELSRRIAALSPEKRALLEKRLERSPASNDGQRIAVIGAGCRLPGGVDSLDGFWAMLDAGVDAISEVPADRWSADALYDPDWLVPGKMATRWGGLVQEIDQFDPEFFDLVPREARRVDPQQRMLLETAWRTIEDAGLVAERLAGSATAVFVGIHNQSSDYYWLQLRDREAIDAYTSTGAAHSISANRLSYWLDLRGPSVAIDSACSSSLVAVHQAMRSLRAGECDLALAGGVNLILAPEPTIAFSKLQMMAADGRCKTFDSRADGYVRGEGCGLVALKRLEDALADGDAIRAVIRGSAVNQDGRTNGLTAPNGLSQQQVITKALEDAGVRPEQVGYVEAHGTGTSLGDPIEIEALGKVLATPAGDRSPCRVGSVKTNIGHLEAAAGIAGLIKAMLCLRHGRTPPHLHFEQLNPHIRLDGRTLAIGGDRAAWPEGRDPIAGVSSFGFGGTNAHVVLERAPAIETTADRSAAETSSCLLPVSARSTAALSLLAESYASALTQHDAPLADIAYSAGCRRTHHEQRLAVVGDSADQIAARLRAHAHGESDAGVVKTDPARATDPSLVFVFCGRGAQRESMGLELLDSEPLFRETLERVDALHRELGGSSLIDDLRATGERCRLARTDVAQVALFAVQLGLAELLRGWGVVPDAVVGHGVGEVAAAHVSGALDLEDAVRVVYHRGRLMQQAAGEACHGPAMEPLCGPLTQALEGLRPSDGTIPWISTVTGLPCAAGDHGADYWARNIRQPVLFAAAIEQAIGRGHGAFLEVGPDPVLAASIGETSVPSLRRDSGERESLLTAAATLWVQGRSLSWEHVQPAAGRFVRLPPHPWQKRRCWIDPPRDIRTSGDSRTDASLLGERVAAPIPIFESILHPRALPETAQHTVGGIAVYPLVAYIESMRQAARDGLGYEPGALRDLRLHEVLRLDGDVARRVQLLLTPSPGGGGEAQLFSRLQDSEDESWTLHATATLMPADADTIARTSELGQAEQRDESGNGQIDGDTFVEQLRARGIDLGRAADAIRSVRSGTRLASAEIVADPGQMTLPRALSAALALLVRPADEGLEVPVAVDSCRLSEPRGDRFRAVAFRRDDGRVDLELIDSEGRVAASLTGIRLRPMPASATGARWTEWLYDLDWVARPLRQAPAEGHLPMPAEIADAVRVETHRSGSLAAIKGFGELFPVLESLCIEHVVGALGRLGWTPSVGETFDPAGLGSRLGVDDRHQRLLERMIEMLGEEGLLERSADGRWTVVRPLSARPALPSLSELESRYPEGSAELALVGRCAANLDDVLRGESDPLELLFPGGSSDDVERIYRDSPLSHESNRWVASAVEKTLDSLPPGRVARILEIGAGTGGTTAQLIPMLAGGRADYVLTDVAPLLVNRATRKFRDHSFLSCRQLDIESDPSAQGFDAGSFDLVIAANVLHATADLRSTLGHVRELLAPGGVLLLLEVTPRQRWLDLTFGLTDGWWKFRDHDIRPTYPLLPAAEWRRLLNDTGFESSASLPDGESASTVLAQRALLVARTPEVKTRPAEIALPPEREGRWIILADRAGVGEELARQVRALGQAALLVSPGRSYDQTEPGRAVIDPANLDHYRRLLGGDATYDRPPLSTIVQLWSSDTHEPLAGGAISELDHGLCAVSTSQLVRAIAEQRQSTPPKLWLVTRNAQATPATNATLSPLQSTVWGLGRVLGLEHPELFGSLIDLSAGGTKAADAQSILDEVTGGDGEDQVALAGSARFVPRLVRKVHALEGGDWSPRSDASYLITGGLGGLGLEVARWLVARGARHLVLLSRSDLGPRDAWSSHPQHSSEHARCEAIRRIEASGATVRPAAVDVADRGQLADFLTRLAAEGPPLRGVIHAAADLDFRALAELDPPALHAMLRPKVHGAWNLHELTRDTELDVFVLFSSTTSLLGVSRMGHYAAANQFLDVLAHRRRAEGLPATSFNWGTWETMRTLSEQSREHVARHGLNPMPVDLALDALGQLAGAPAAQQIVASIDWSLLKPAYEAKRKRPLLERIEVPRSYVRRPAIPERIETTRPAGTQTTEALVERIQLEVATILDLAPGTPVDPRQGFFEMGLDSLTSVELRRRLEGVVGQPLPQTLTFNFPNVMALAEHLAGCLAGPVPATEEATPAPSARDQVVDVSTSVEDDELSTDELVGLIREKLRQIR